VALNDGYDIEVIPGPAQRRISRSDCWRTPAHDARGLLTSPARAKPEDAPRAQDDAADGRHTTCLTDRSKPVENGPDQWRRRSPSRTWRCRRWRCWC